MPRFIRVWKQIFHFEILGLMPETPMSIGKSKDRTVSLRTAESKI